MSTRTTSLSALASSALVCASLALAACGAGSSSGGEAGAGASAGSGGGAGASGAAGGGGAAGAAGSGVGCSAPPRELWTWDLSVMPPVDVKIPATCRAETAHALVYVADDAWGGAMNQASVDAIANAFEHATPADPARGIYQTTVETFGEPPDVDADPRIVLFYVPMAGYQGYSFDGFFRSLDQSPGAKSNLMEMLHLNATGSQKPDSDYMLGVVAHELVHLIAWRYDPSEEGWLEESLAEAAMVRAGYMTDLKAGQSYAKATSTTPLCVRTYSDYGATFSWGAYALDRFGPSFLRAVLQDPADGRASYQAHLPAGMSFRQVFGEFMVATLLDRPEIGDGRFGYSSVDLGGLGSETAASFGAGPQELGSVAFGARALRFTPPGAGTASISLGSAELAKLVVHSLSFDPAEPGAAEITAHDPAGGPIVVPVAAGQVIDLVIAIDAGPALEKSQGAPITSFSYDASFSP
jgi:hypothetical protein